MQPSGVKTLTLAINKINKNVQPYYLKAILRTEASDEYSLRPTLSLFFLKGVLHINFYKLTFTLSNFFQCIRYTETININK